MSNELSLPLSLIFSKSFSEGELPQDWKDAIITPLHKKGEKEFTSNYRPISLTSIVCKIMESIIKDDILACMVSNKILTNLQHEFVPGKSCQSNLSLVRLHLEYCVSIWYLLLRKDEELIENVLRRANKIDNNNNDNNDNNNNNNI